MKIRINENTTIKTNLNNFYMDMDSIDNIVHIDIDTVKSISLQRNCISIFLKNGRHINFSIVGETK